MSSKSNMSCYNQFFVANKYKRLKDGMDDKVERKMKIFLSRWINKNLYRKEMQKLRRRQFVLEEQGDVLKFLHLEAQRNNSGKQSIILIKYF